MPSLLYKKNNDEKFRTYIIRYMDCFCNPRHSGFVREYAACFLNNLRYPQRNCCSRQYSDFHSGVQGQEIQKIFGCMSCNCNGSDLRKKYSGMFFSSVGSKPEREYEKKLREKEKEKQKDEKILD